MNIEELSVMLRVYIPDVSVELVSLVGSKALIRIKREDYIEFGGAIDYEGEGAFTAAMLAIKDWKYPAFEEYISVDISTGLKSVTGYIYGWLIGKQKLRPEEILD